MRCQLLCSIFRNHLGTKMVSPEKYDLSTTKHLELKPLERLHVLMSHVWFKKFQLIVAGKILPQTLQSNIGYWDLNDTKQFILESF